MPNAVVAWKKAEQRVFQYLQAVLRGDYEVSSFCPEIPMDFDYTTLMGDGRAAGMWSFALNGPGPMHPMSHGEPGGWQVWQMDGELEGLWMDRDEAMRVAGAILDALPAAENSSLDDFDLYGIDDVRMSAMPTIERGVLNLKADDSHAGEPMRGWRMTIPFQVNFRNVGD
jgi:hypothetical protein